MTDAENTPALPDGPATREALLELYRLMVNACVDYLKDRPTNKLRGSMLDVIRKVLVDAGITAEVREAIQARRALADLKDAASDLDSFTAPFPTVEQ